METRKVDGPYTRTLAFERASIDQSSRTVELAISSEAPVERWFGTEILGHNPGEIDLSRMLSGAPLLVNHDSADQVGVVEEVRLDPDQVLRGRVRFGRSARAEEIFQDVIDGIRGKVSVGYQILKYDLTKGANGAADTVRATLWQPMETSLVAIPADDSVGVGRSASDPEAPLTLPATPAGIAKEFRMEPTITAAAPAVDPLAERQEALQIQALGESLGIGSAVREILASTANLTEARAKAMQALSERAGKPLAAGPVVTLEGKERFSIARAIAAKLDGRNCFEMEVSQEIGRKLGRDTNGIFVPTSTRANPPMDTATSSYGQKLVFTEQGEFIDLLRAKMTLLGLGAQFLTGLRGNLSFPRQLTANTANWLQENAASAVTAAAFTTDLVTLTPKQLVAQTSVTRNLLAQSTPAVDALINNDLAAIHAIAIEVAAINGAGSGSYQPLGILGTSSIGDVACGTNGAQPTYANIVDLESAVATANADQGAMAYLTSPGIRGRLKQTQQFSSTNGDSVWDYLMAAYPRSTVTNNIPQTLVKNTSGSVCHAVVFGNFADLVIGEWGAFELIPDPLTQAGKGLVVLTTNQLVDSAVRRPGSFAAIKDALK